MKNLEIKDEATSSQEEKTDQQVEVQVLQSGQIEFSAPSTTNHYSSHEKDNATLNCEETNTSTFNILSMPVTTVDIEERQQNLTDLGKDQRLESTSIDEPSLPTVSPPVVSNQIPQSFPICTSTPLIIRRNHKPKNYSSAKTCATNTDITSTNSKLIDDTSNNNSEGNQRQLRRSSRRLSQKTVNTEENMSPSKTQSYNLRQKQNQSPSINCTSSSKRCKRSEKVCDQHLVPSEHQKNLERDCNPMEWCVDEVTEFINSIPRCNYSEIFREHVRKLLHNIQKFMCIMAQITRKFLHTQLCIKTLMLLCTGSRWRITDEP